MKKTAEKKTLRKNALMAHRQFILINSTELFSTDGQSKTY
jgi:hypothetical protein